MRFEHYLAIEPILDLLIAGDHAAAKAALQGVSARIREQSPATDVSAALAFLALCISRTDALSDAELRSAESLYELATGKPG